MDRVGLLVWMKRVFCMNDRNLNETTVKTQMFAEKYAQGENVLISLRIFLHYSTKTFDKSRCMMYTIKV